MVAAALVSYYEQLKRNNFVYITNVVSAFDFDEKLIIESSA